MQSSRWAKIVGALLSVVLVMSHPVSYGQQSSDIEISNISGSPDAPRRHSRIKDTIELDDNGAKKIYAIVRAALAASVGASSLNTHEDYQSLRQFNSAPYRSVSHGNHYLNNYANDLGSVYGEYEDAGVLPQGAVLYKDSFSVAANNEIILGPLFIMEKMQPGFNPVGGDWKYIQINPTGEVLGETNGPGSDRVEYCIACHLTREQYDHLFFMPEKSRVTP